MTNKVKKGLTVLSLGLFKIEIMLTQAWTVPKIFVSKILFITGPSHK